MNARSIRVREYYSYAMLSGFTYTEARRQKPGFILDMYKARIEYDARMAGARMARKVGL